MKKQEKQVFEKMKLNELSVEVVKLQKQLVEASLKKNTGQLKNLRQVKFIRHDIARLKTMIHQKEVLARLESKQPTKKENA